MGIKCIEYVLHYQTAEVFQVKTTVCVIYNGIKKSKIILKIRENVI